MNNFLIIAQLVLAVLLMLAILSQEKGAGLEATFGGMGEIYRSKRGIDRILFWVTIIITLLFIANSIALLFIDNQTPQSSAPANDINVEDIQVETE